MCCNRENIKKRAPQVDIVFGPQTIHRIPSMINTASQENKKLAIDISFPLIEKFDYIPTPNICSVSEYVTIMEGCEANTVHSVLSRIHAEMR